MTNVFMKILNMSIAGGLLALVVAVLRLAFRRAPRKLFLLLWGLVALRLVLPVTFSSRFSLVPDVRGVLSGFADEQDAAGDETQQGQTVRQAVENAAMRQYGIDPDDLLAEKEQAKQSVGRNQPGAMQNNSADTQNNSAVGAQSNTGSVSHVSAPSVTETVTGKRTDNSGIKSAGFPLVILWLCGIAGMLFYTLMDYIRIHRRVREAIRQEDGTWRCDRIGSPFILGILRPRIYIPAATRASDLPYVIAHEKAHLQRRDHILKAFGFVLLTVYWFNPLIWAAYILFCRDLEYACDEAVITSLGGEIKKPYAAALIHCSMERRTVAPSPLSFAEVSVKSRIKNVLHYKKAPLWASILCVVLCLALGGCFMTDPRESSSTDAPAASTKEAKGQEAGKAQVTEPAGVIESATAGEVENTSEKAADIEKDTSAETAADPSSLEASQTESTEESRSGESQDHGSLPAEAREVLQSYVTDILSSMAADSSRTFLPEEFASIEGYIASKNMELRRQYFNRNYDGGVTDLKVGVTIISQSEAANGQTSVSVRGSQSYTCGGVYRAVDQSDLLVHMIQENGTWKCVDIMAKGYDRLLNVDLSILHHYWVPPSSYKERTPKEVDEVLGELYGRLGKGDAGEGKIQSMESEQWTKEELKLAADAVKLHCVAKGRKLLELRLATPQEIRSYKGAAVLHPEKTIVFLGGWQAGEGSHENENTLYEGWAWFVNPNDVGGWVVEDEGY